MMPQPLPPIDSSPYTQEFKMPTQLFRAKLWSPTRLVVEVHEHYAVYTCDIWGAYTQTSGQSYGGFTLDTYAKQYKKRIITTQSIKALKELGEFLELPPKELQKLDTSALYQEKYSINLETTFSLSSTPFIALIEDDVIYALLKKSGSIYSFQNYFCASHIDRNILTNFKENLADSIGHSQSIGAPQYDFLANEFEALKSSHFIIESRLINIEKSLLETNIAPTHSLDLNTYKV